MAEQLGRQVTARAEARILAPQAADRAQRAVAVAMDRVAPDETMDHAVELEHGARGTTRRPEVGPASSACRWDVDAVEPYRPMEDFECPVGLDQRTLARLRGGGAGRYGRSDEQDNEGGEQP